MEGVSIFGLWVSLTAVASDCFLAIGIVQNPSVLLLQALRPEFQQIWPLILHLRWLEAVINLPPCFTSERTLELLLVRFIILLMSSNFSCDSISPSLQVEFQYLRTLTAGGLSLPPSDSCTDAPRREQNHG